MFADLNGKRAIVTGAAGGIGAAIARRLAAEGTHVAVLDIDLSGASATASSLGTSAIGIRCDVRSPEEVSTAISRAVEFLGGLEVLVNNAGITGPVQPLVEYAEADFLEVVDVNLLGTYRVTRAAVPHLACDGRSRVVNIASISGKEGNPNMTAYAAAKAGVVGFTKALGKELASTGVLVNCVAPGGVGGTHIIAGPASAGQQLPHPVHPIGRLATPEEVAALVAWLCSEQMSFSAGAVFDISGVRATY